MKYTDNQTPYLKIVLAGRGMSVFEAEKLENVLQADADNLDVRAKLFGFDWGNRQNDKDAFLRHIYWALERPELELSDLIMDSACALKRTDALAYEELKKFIFTLCNSKTCDSTFLAKMSQIFETNHDLELSQKFLREAKLNDSSELLWKRRLSQLYERWMHEDFGKNNLDECLTLREELISKITDPAELFFEFIGLPKLYFLAERFDKSLESAKNLLQLAKLNNADVANYGYAVHIAHTVLGLVALKKANLQLALDNLSASSDAPYSYRYFLDGPDLSLARSLFERGERASVKLFVSKLRLLKFSEQQQRVLAELQECIVNDKWLIE